MFADTIAMSGHGLLFDSGMREIKLTDLVITTLQDSILEEISRRKFKGHIDQEVADAIASAQDLMQSAALTFDEQRLVNSAIIEARLRSTPKKFRDKYLWRNRVLASALMRRGGFGPVPRPLIIEAWRSLDFIGADFQVVGDTPYMSDCRSKGVPIPPDWAEDGTAWVFQGQLEQNLLDPGEDAAVYTYSHPSLRGGCIALPRGDGSPGSLAGIICQNATNGHACFWDNKKRGQVGVIGWKGLRLVIADLQDATDLSTNCTSCHSGENVFIISPDDPTWAKLLRGPLNGPDPGTFTTRVESSSERNSRGQPRYIPLSLGRTGWVNTERAMTCAGACHETPANINRPPMPPACANSATDPRDCYAR
ncbi:MAG: hypothetical protein AAF657_21650 [Acidobacteriota bacterium]